MKERPILFSGPMVNAILEGRKTQTRRTTGFNEINEDPSGWFFNGFVHHGDDLFAVLSNKLNGKVLEARCQYGKSGDRFWVRENLEASHHGLHYAADQAEVIHDLADALNEKYTSDYYNVECRTIPSIHMPRWASRITLEITGVRVERLNYICAWDALSEGIKPQGICANTGDVVSWYDYLERNGAGIKPKDSFESLWESINGAGSWQQNPWVWVVQFKVVQS